MSDSAPLPAGNDPADWIGWTSVQQSLASDPARSAWVSANAGSGKTHVLTQRVIRLLLSGARPSAILCLTYTKAGASEMSNRVFGRLSRWATLDDEGLAREIASIGGGMPDAPMLAAARRLFASALDTPGGLKIQTIHAFCEALLHQFPLEANVAGHFSVLDERAAAALLSDARRALLSATSSEGDPVLAEAFAHVLSTADETGLETLLSDIVANRDAIRRFMLHAERHGGVDATLRARFGLDATETEAGITRSAWPLPDLAGPRLDRYLELADAKGGAKVLDAVHALRLAVREPESATRFALLEQVFLTQKGEPKADSSLLAKAMRDAAPDLSDAIDAARSHIVACRDRLRRMRMLGATLAALTLADRLGRDYEDLKKKRSQLDFEDLIVRTADLLTRSGIGPWVHYKLDQGIDHILVDEAQDTSPAQWTIVQSLAEDFFSGQSARPMLRTLFAVGDEKQSIYSFQGARPERFAQESSLTRTRVEASGLPFSSVRLPLSFRSTSDVLSAVDQVFSVRENARGLSAHGDAVVHLSSRIGHAGAVDVWDMIVPGAADADEDWTAPFDATPESAPAAILARRITHRIEKAVTGETIIEKNVERPVEPGDILVLVRKRDGFVNALTRALKRRGSIPVAGADRLLLTSHIAIQDLMALGRFVILPQDDLSLAALLKSPLFDLAEEDVFQAAALRGAQETLWDHIRRLGSEGVETFTAAVSRLERFMTLSARLPVHDFYARVLGEFGGRRQFLARLGTEVSDILDEFLTFALDHEKSGLPGLQALISTLETEAPVVKREQDKGRNEVRIMTVHAAKGLEAPIVFLVDGGGKAFTHTHLSKFRLLPSQDGAPPVPAWVPVTALKNALTDADAARIQQLAEEEYRRLLYVAMTRAADRLIVCGYRGVRDNGATWQRMIADALLIDPDHAETIQFEGPDGPWGGIAWRATRGPARDLERKPREAVLQAQTRLPAALLRPLPPQVSLPRPLSPSGAGFIIDDGADDLIVTSPLFAETRVPDHAAARGRLIHRMLQTLPVYPATERQTAAERYISRATPWLAQTEASDIVRSVMAVLEHPDLTFSFSGNSQAEVSVMGTLVLDGKDYAVSGRIDRLFDDGETVRLIDYKTNRVPPADPSDIPFSHRAQLAIYRDILQPLYPGRRFDCVLVYTQSASVFTITQSDLDAALARIKTK